MIDFLKSNPTIFASIVTGFFTSIAAVIAGLIGFSIQFLKIKKDEVKESFERKMNRLEEVYSLLNQYSGYCVEYARVANDIIGEDKEGKSLEEYGKSLKRLDAIEKKDTDRLFVLTDLYFKELHNENLNGIKKFQGDVLCILLDFHKGKIGSAMSLMNLNECYRKFDTHIRSYQRLLAGYAEKL